jgi:hypothetical protein
MGKDIKNPMGLLSKMMLEVSLFDPIQALKEKKEAEQTALKQQQIIETKKKELEQEVVNKVRNQLKTKIEQIEILIDNNPTLPEIFLGDLKKQGTAENPSFIVQLAYNNYKTNIEGILPNSKQEILYNYELGGSFSAYMMDWFLEKYKI